MAGDGQSTDPQGTRDPGAMPAGESVAMLIIGSPANDPTNPRFRYGGGNVLTLERNDQGAGMTLNVSQSYQVGGTQVVQGRQNGWGASTGGVRGQVAAGTATLAQVAAAVAQLLEDLKSHGLLGA